MTNSNLCVLTPPSDISGLPYLLHEGELLSLRDPHKWILRPILGLGRDRYVFAVYHPCWLVTTPGVLISGHIGVGVIFSGRKGGYLSDLKFDKDSESGLKNRCYLSHISRY